MSLADSVGRMRRRTIAGAFLVATAAGGCNAIVGVDDKELVGAAATGAGGATSVSTASAIGSGGSDGGAGGAGGAGGGGAGGCEPLDNERRLFQGPGAYSGCVGKPDECGALYCWGYNATMQLGIETSDPQIAVSPRKVTAVDGPLLYASTTGDATCVLHASGALSCVGSAEFGQLGNGNYSGPDECAAAPGCNASGVTVFASGVAEVGAGGWWCGGRQTCARTSTGQVFCWGQRGGCDSVATVAVPALVEGLEDAVELHVGGSFACARRVGGSVWCWGANSAGNLGPGDFEPRDGAVEVPGVAGATAIGGGIGHACAVTPEGIFCWGFNSTAQLGNGATDSLDDPSPGLVVSTPGLEDVVDVAAAFEATCALTAAGEVFCWGRSDLGMIGDGTEGGDVCANGTLCRAAPVRADVEGVVELTMGNAYALARLRDGSLVAWGRQVLGELGNGAQEGEQLAPAPVIGFP